MNLITSGTLAKKWGVSRQRINQLVQAGRLDYVDTLNGAYLFAPGTKKPDALTLGRPPLGKRK